MAPKAAYVFTLLSEYTHTLDSLPLDLSKNFADLRELDAVLSSSISGITAKIHQLIELIEDPKSCTPAERLAFLREIAEEAGRLKLGGDDKIRVACHASDNLHAHQTHLNNILRMAAEHDPLFHPDRLSTRTTYPHVSPRSLAEPSPLYESGRRKRVPQSSSGNRASLAAFESPAKKKKLSRDDDDVALPISRRPQLDKTDLLDRVPYNPHNRGDKTDKNGATRVRGQRKPDPQRGGSPTESLHSIGSSMPINRSVRAANGAVHQTNGNGSAGSPLGRPDVSRDNTSLLDAVLSRKDGASSANGYTNGGAPMALPAISHSNYSGGMQPSSQHVNGSAARAQSPYTNAHDDDPGAANGHQTNGTDPADDQGDDAQGDDDRTYCICDTASYGEMVACDDNACEREWFHLGCLGLSVPPKGTWFCDACKSKRAAERAKKARGGKKKTMARGSGRGGRN